MKHSIIGIIPARGGSKGIPKKNIIRIAGKPLIAWTIEAARGSRLLDRVVVSSDDSEILSIARKYGCEAIKRPKKYAADHVSTDETSLNILDTLKRKEKYVPDIIVLLQPTSPLRTSDDIDNAILLLLRRKAGAVISVAEGDKKHLKSFFMRDGYLRGIVDHEYAFMNRQDLPNIYMPNGALFIIYEKEFRKNKIMFSSKTLGFLMEKERSIDVDIPEDIPVVGAALKRFRGDVFQKQVRSRHRRKELRNS